jgi:hypothetical protein
VNAARTLVAMAAWTSSGRSASVTLAWIAFRSRNSVFGSPFEAVFNPWMESITAEKMISCISSVALFVMPPCNAPNCFW